MPKITRMALFALVSLLLAPAIAQARTHIAVAVADESPAMFSSPAYQALHLKRTRYFIPWNAIKNQRALDSADQFVAAARAAHVKVLMHISTDTYTHGKAKLPSVSSYKKYVGALIRRYKPQGVTEWGTWNEENHVSEPTNKSPRRAAQYFEAMYRMCHHCTVVALDLLDSRDAPRYVRSFYRSLSRTYKARAKLVGVHNYEDVNYKRTSGTRGVINAVRQENRHAKFWLTETGGLVHLSPHFSCSTHRAALRTSYMFSFAKKLRHYVTRLYIFSWGGGGCGGFDAGLVGPDGRPRSAYDTVKRELSSFTR